MFDWLYAGLGYVIRFCYNIFNNYGVALLFFALILKVVLFPFGIKQQKNMVKQAKLRPREMAIRKKYAGRNDAATKQKIQQEIMALYQEEKFNPMGGCLPMLIQLPVLFALYNVIRNPLTYICNFSTKTINGIKDFFPELYKVVDGTKEYVRIEEINLIGKMKEAGLENFEGISGFNAEGIPNFKFFGLDLSKIPSEFFWPLIIIPVLTFVFTFASSKLTRKLSYQAPSAEDAANSKSLKIMEFSMPLLSTFLAYTMPAALGVYWIYNNIFTVVQQYVLTKLYPYPKFTEEDYKAAEKAVGSSKKSKSKEIDPNKPKVRSLHHIDDDEFEEIYGKKKKEKTSDDVTKAPEKNNEEKIEPEEKKPTTEDKDIPVIKDDGKTKYKKKD